MSFDARRKDHEVFADEIAATLAEEGFAVCCPAYHEHMSAEIVSLLKRLDTPTTDLARNGADLFAIHRSLPLAIFVEAKTHRFSRYHNLAVEARQFVQRIEEAVHGSMCLFCYRDPGLREVGFWVHECPPVECVLIPERWDDEQVEHWEQRFADVLPGVPVRRTSRTAGGADTPFALISEQHLIEMPHWHRLVAELVAQVGALQEVGAL